MGLAFQVLNLRATSRISRTLHEIAHDLVYVFNNVACWNMLPKIIQNRGFYINKYKINL